MNFQDTLEGFIIMSTPLSKMGKNQIEFLLKDNNDPTVAKQFGITRQAVYNIRKKFGIPSSKSKASDKKQRIIELRNEGLSVTKVSSVCNVSQSYVYKVLKEAFNAQKRENSSDQNPS